MEVKELRKKIMLPFVKLDFNEEKHVYFVDNKPLRVSVSGLIKNFYKKFPTEEKAQEIVKGNKFTGAVNKYSGMTEKEILKKWKEINIEATTRGTRVHEFGEIYPFNKKLKPRCKQEEAIVKFWDSLPSHIIPVTMELRMYHFKEMYGGTADIILYDTVKKAFIIADYKTNKDLFKNYQGQKLLSPFRDLLDSPFNHYQIQLNYYQILMEQIKDVKVCRKIIVYLNLEGDFKMYDVSDLRPRLLNKELWKQ